MDSEMDSDMAGCGCETEYSDAQFLLPIVFIEDPYITVVTFSIDLDYPLVKSDADFIVVTTLFNRIIDKDRPPPDNGLFLLNSALLI